jgi:hypothetical protein
VNNDDIGRSDRQRPGAVGGRESGEFKTLTPVTDARPSQAPGHTVVKIGTTFGPGVFTGSKSR